ncbi:hypothetical protein VN12_22825 [Pirellula sp. SH-Sr6A]|uniref:SHD1 domain-containing protein n=1 Tax=Pirellula sp. SH-Sr6A TaxID=1632865 RepID=UPI00078D8387|nr:SHD1 domain-containing protein [Pirellula sp. SH-Sr6A]AMV34979.1 hypothetical protein VN12_22825 [Pirellula sp. SH-Sr6A]
MHRIAFLLLLPIASIAYAQEKFGGSEIIASQNVDQPNNFTAETPYGEITIVVKSPIVYLPKSGKTGITSFAKVGLMKDGKDVDQTNGFFDTKPKPIKVRIGESEAYTKNTIGEVAELVFSKPGSVQLIVVLGDDTIVVPIEVVQLPFEVGMESDIVIEELGFPSSKTTHFVKWPKNEFVEGVFYSVSATESIISFEHWKYKDLPHCIIAVDENKIKGINSVCIDPTDPVLFPEAYRQAILESYSKKDAPAAPEKAHEEAREERLEDYRIWSDRKGNKVEAKFIRYSDSKVTLETKDKRRIDVRINQLVEADATLAKKFNSEIRSRIK